MIFYLYCIIIPSPTCQITHLIPAFACPYRCLCLPLSLSLPALIPVFCLTLSLPLSALIPVFCLTLSLPLPHLIAVFCLTLSLSFASPYRCLCLPFLSLPALVAVFLPSWPWPLTLPSSRLVLSSPCPCVWSTDVKAHEKRGSVAGTTDQSNPR